MSTILDPITVEIDDLIDRCIRAIVREEIDNERYARLLMDGWQPEKARQLVEGERADRERIRAGELPPFSQAASE